MFKITYYCSFLTFEYYQFGHGDVSLYVGMKVWSTSILFSYYTNNVVYLRLTMKIKISNSFGPNINNYTKLHVLRKKDYASVLG